MLALALGPHWSARPAWAAPAAGSADWEAQSAPADLKPFCGHLTSVWGSSSSSVFALSRCGTLIRYDGSRWRVSNGGPLGGQDQADGPYYASDIWGTSASNLFVSGHFWPPYIEGFGGIFHFHAGVWTLSERVFGDSSCVNSVWGASSSDVFAVGNDDVVGYIFHYNGTAWSLFGTFEADSPLYDYSLSGVWGSSASNVFAVGGGMWYSQNGIVFRYNGLSWQPMNIGTTPRLLGVWGSSGSDVFVVGEAGTILHYNGSAWSTMYSGTTKDLRGVCGSSASDVFAVGDGGTILHYNGNAWNPMTSGTTKNLNGIWGSASAGFFAVGESGTILHYEDYPDRPTNVSPANGATGVSLTPALQGSDFSEPRGDAHVASSWQIRSSTGNYDKPVWESGKSSPAATSITVPAGKLANGTVYYWRVGYKDSGGLWSSYSAETSFTTVRATPVPPTVVTDAASVIGPTSATLNLRLTGLGSASPVLVSFDWGPGSAYGSTTTPQAMTGAGSFSYPLSGLAAGATYHYRAKAVGDDTAYGRDMTFTTSATPTSPPVVVTEDADSITANSARLNGSLTSLGTAGSATVSFVWGTSKGGPYPNETTGAVQTAGGAFRFDLSGLAPSTTFYYQARAVGDGTSYGAEESFTTGAAAASPGAPSIGGVVANNGRRGDDITVTISGANLSGATAVSFGAGITINDLRVVSDTEITVKLSITSGAEAGKRDVTVATPAGTATSLGGFTVTGGGGRVHLWVYLVAAAGGVAVLGVIASVAIWVLRRPPKPAP